MATAPAATAPGSWWAAPAVAGAEVAAAWVPVLVALIKGVELATLDREALERGVLVDLGVQVEVGVGVEVGVTVVEDGVGVGVAVETGGVYPEGTRVRVEVLAVAEEASGAMAPNAIGAKARRSRDLNCML